MTREEYQKIICERLIESLELKDYKDIENTFSSKKLGQYEIQMEYYKYLKQRNLCGDILDYISKNSKFKDELIETIEMNSYTNLCVIDSDGYYNQLFVISSSDKMRPIALKTLTNKNIREACISIYKYYQAQNKVKSR